ncbi:hybrid sensor histidine kinase/response regulator [Shewanella atlantica]|uniref:Sensory/regulatory protein RpfC n=2 Tax=Shewanella atlantica TaxID=271099 RepID=A0A431VXA1_9GAMM|nr:hybrid sensor histidine kinase/response regulator [Shewanella atlantica]
MKLRVSLIQSFLSKIKPLFYTKVYKLKNRFFIMPFRLLTQWLSLTSIGSKVILSMTGICLLVLMLSASNFIMNTRVKEDTTEVSTHEIPKAIAAINMLDEIGDMNANILEYVLGEVDERSDFDQNQIMFTQYLARLKKALKAHDRRIDEIEELFNDFHTSARANVFNRYNPNNEAWAKQRVHGLTNVTGHKLEVLLDSLKESEIKDVGSQPELDEVIHDDLPGVRYYLELVDEAGDMTANLTEYISGIYNAKSSFIENAQNFEEYLTKLKPLEQKPEEIALLAEVEALYKVLRDGGFEVFQRYNSSNKIEAIKAIDELEHQTFARLERLLDDVSIDAEKNTNQELLGLREVTTSNQYVLVISLVLVLTLCISIIYFSYRIITRPITKLSNTMKQLADGDIEVDVVYRDRHDEVGNMAQAVEVFKTNMIARNAAELELVMAKDNAEAASKAKASFLATMSHEIRTPMNGIIGMIDLLLTSSLNRDQRSMTNTIRDSSFSLLNIINDILDFSKIEAGKLELESLNFSISELLESVVDTITPHADEKKVTLELYTDPDIPHHIQGDPVRIRQVLFNLVGNAVKFSADQDHGGEVRISLKKNELRNRLVFLTIEIQDNGIGIEAEQLERLFQPFTQAESSTTRRFGGTGLGLAICHNLINLMGGKIDVASTVDKGSIFKVNLSFPYLERPLSLTHNYQKVLVINDIDSELLSIRVQEYLSSKEVNIISMPYVNLSEHLRENVETWIQIVIATDQLEQSRQRVEQSFTDAEQKNIRFLVLKPTSRGDGIIDDITFSIAASPLKISTLLYGLHVALGRESPLDSSAQEADALSHTPLSITDAEKAGRLILVAEDNQTNQEVIKRQLSKLGYSCVVADDGVHAEELYPTYKFAMVLTDCHMPKRDGYELARVLRGIQKKSGIEVPIIAITANALVGESEKCIAAGMDDYLSKPVELVKLSQMLKKWLSSPLKNSIDTDKKQTGAEKRYLDQNVISLVFDDDREDYFAALSDFMEIALPQIKSMVEDRDFDIDAIGQLAHKLKSSAKTVGLLSIGNHCETIEAAAKRPDNQQTRESITEQLDSIETLLPLIEKEITGVISDI